MFSRHSTAKATNPCRTLRRQLTRQVARQLTPHLGQLQNHLAHCQRCQRRLLTLGRVSLALTLLKSQTHPADLLARANQQAIGTLAHQARQLPVAQRLRHARPASPLWQRLTQPARWTANAAACLAVLILGRLGVLSSMQTIQTESRDTLHHLYANAAGDDIADDLFQV